MKFDFEGARKAGLSDSEIVQYLSTLPNNGNLNALKEMGASDSHIVDLWSGSKNFSIATPQESQTPKNNPLPTEQPQIQKPKDVKSLFDSINPAEEKLPPITQEQTREPIENTPSEENIPKIGNPDFSTKPVLSEQQEPKPQAIQTEQEPPKPEDSFGGVLMDILDDGLGISLSEQRAKIRQKRNEYLAEKIVTRDAKSYNDLDDEEKNFIRNKYDDKKRILGFRNPFSMLDKNDDKFQSVKKDLQKEHQIKQILDSDLSYDDLSLPQKQLVNDKMGIFQKFSNPQEVFEDLKSEYQIHKIAPTIEKSISELNNVSANKRLYNIFNSDPSLRDKYLQDVYNIATNAGFDNVSVNTAKHKMYLIKDEKAYEVKDGFFDSIWDDIKSSKFELGASLAGAVAGSKVGPTPQQKLLGGIIGGAIGAVGGSGLDYQINSWLLKRKKDSDELLGKMLEAGALSAVGDVATLGAIKLVKGGYNSLKKIPAYANELRENFTSQNINGAMKLLEDVGISKSQAESVAKKMDKYVETRFVADKDDSFLDKALSKVSKINDSVRQKEKIAFDVAYADPVLWKYIGAVAKNEPKFSNFIHNSITQRAKKISLDPEVKLGDIQEAIKEYEQSLTSQYGEAIDLLDTALPNYRFYPQEFLENKLSKIAEHIGENKSEGIIAGLNNQIKDMGDGLNVSQMIDIRKLINKTLRRNARFDYNDIGALKDINSYIDSNIEDALLKNAKSEPKLEVLYDEWKKINAKYRDYKELQDSKLYKDIFSDNYNNDEKLGNAFINWSKTDEKLTDSIIGRLDPRMQDKTQAFILAKSIDKHIQDTLNDGKVVDFLELKKTLSHLEDKITNKSLKDHIDILKDMADLFYNDINLMRESGQINILTPNSGSGISHDLIARAHTSTISNIYRTIQRFLPTTAGKNSAFLYHLGKAMNMSRNSKELIFDLVSSPDTPPSLLKDLRPAIEAYNGRVGNAIDNAQEIQTQKDQQNYLDMLESSQKYQRSLDDTSINPQTLERIQTAGVSDVGSTGEQAIPHRGDTEGLLLDSGKIRATNGNRDGEFGRVSGSDEGGDRPLRSPIDGGRDEGARTTGKIPQEPQEIRETNKSTTRTPRGRLETSQTPESTIITQEGLPPSPSLNNLAKSLKKTKDPLENITDFGTNYPEYYHDGKGAIEKLLQEKQGQVQGAFYKEGLGDIDLVWGEVTNAEKHTGYGLAHILDKHPEITPEKLENIIAEGKATIRNNEAVKIEKDGYKVVLKGNWKGEPTENKWVVTAYENNREAPSISSDANHIKESLSKTSSDNPTTEQLKNQVDLEYKAKEELIESWLQKFDDSNKKKLGNKKNLSKLEGNELFRKLMRDWWKKHKDIDDEDIEMLHFHYLQKELLTRIQPYDKQQQAIEIASKDIAKYKQKILQKSWVTDLDSKKPTKFSPSLKAEKISEQLSEELKEAYNKYESTKSTQYQETKEIEKSDDVVGITANVYTRVADEIMSKNPLELALHNNWVKENMRTPFGINFKKSPLKPIRGKEALETLLTYKLGQVQGAFYKGGLGNIDLVWGNEKMGLAHILEKHPEVVEKIPEIIEKGEVVKNGEFETIVLKNNELYKVGLSKGWHDNRGNSWVITAYEDTRLLHSDLLPSNGVTSRDVLPSNNLESNPTTEQLKNQELLNAYDQLKKKYPGDYLDFIHTRYIQEGFMNKKDPYQELIDSYQKQIKNKKTSDGEKLAQNVLEERKYFLKMLNDPEVEKFIKSVTDDVMEVKQLEDDIKLEEQSLKNYKKHPKADKEVLESKENKIQKYKNAYETKMKEIYGKYPIETKSKEDLIKEAFSEFSTIGTLSETTKEALEKSGSKVETEGEKIIISHRVEKADKDLEPLPTPSTPEAVITPDGYTQYDGLGDVTKKISITPDSISNIQKQGDIITSETLDLTNNTSTKQVEVKNPEINLPITSPSSSSAPSSSIIAKLKDDFKIDPNATIPKSPKQRFDNNIEAIRILKKLEQNKALPTLEEKQKLSLYVGWGGLSNSFKEDTPSDKLLRELLSEEEYSRARNSTLSSYYTPYFVVDSMYKALQKMGFSGGEILEPSVGVGNFFALLPDSLRHTSNLTGIELDDTTAKIAKYLYPSAKIEHTGFENALLSKNNYDLVIGNPPYGSFSVYDKNFKKESKHNIHNYFMLKNLALAKEDGILAQIITTNFLDTKNPEVRELIAKEAEFLGAIRLPQGSFDDTQVATDIVFFRKLKKGESSPSKEWVNLKSIPDSQGKEDIFINSYFANNPQYMLGTPGRYGGMYGADTVGFKSNGNTEVQLQKAIEDMTEGIHIDTRPILASSTIAQKTIDNLEAKPIDGLLHSGYIRPGGIALDAKSKEIYRLNQKEELEKVPDLELIDKTQGEFDKLTEIGKKAKLAQIKRIKEMIPAITEIRDTLMHLKRLQLDPMQPDSLISSYRKELNTLYDNFRNTHHTFLNDSKIAKAFDGDPTYPHIAALEEDYKRVDKKYRAKKADIFTKRTQFPYVKPTKAKDIEDGIFISYNQTGRLDFDTIASLLDKDSKSIKKEMLDKNLAFKDVSGDIIYAPEFLSGNIKAKIKSFEEKELDAYQNKALNVLLKVIPPKVEIEGIGINMGANYIPIEIYQDFAKEVLGGGEGGVIYQELTDRFIVNFKSSIEADKAFGVVGKHKTISASDVFDSALNDRKITMGVKTKEDFHPDLEGQNALDQQIGAIKEAFKNFIYDDYKRAEKIENVYNDIFNNTRLREFDGSFLKLEGSNTLISLRPHQKNAIYRIISSPTTLLDHTVGTGKTYTMVGSAMELRRLGLAKKPLFVVPNHIVNQFGAEFARLYPDANILATRKFDKKSRQRTLLAITTGDWDAIIIGHSNFEMLPMSKQAEIKFMSEQINAFEKAIKEDKIQRTGSSLSVKQLESALESKKRKLDELMDTKRDETINFEDLGVDALFLDEAHEFKNLEFFSKQNISGLGTQKGSKKAFDLFMKTRYLTNENKKIIFATGTPISNSIAELYTLQKYLDFEGLKQKKINSFDQWSKTFGKVETRFEYHPSGHFKLTNRFSGYINMPELIKEYKKFSDVIVNEDVEAMLKLQGKEFDLPKADFITIDIKKSPRQEKFMQEIMDRSADIDNGKVEPYEDNYLKVTTDGKKGSLDMRLINPLYEDSPDSKVNTSITNIIKEYNKWKQDKGTQLVFLDMSTPKNKNPKAKKELDELLKRIEQGDEEAEETLRAKGGNDYIKVINNDGFSVYEDIKDKLIKEGIPEKEIAFIHDFDTDKKKAELFAKVNDGDIRILLGSTSKMGAGTNVQERIVAIHHLDAPWRPADIEQRNGRGIRQGNSLYEKYGKDKFKVNIYTYVTKGMLDTMIFEKLHTKAKFISQLRKGELNGREIEDIGDEVLNFAEIQAATLEDRRYLEILELKRDIDSLTALQKNIANINLRTTREINALEYELKHKPKEIQSFKTDMEAFNKGGNKVQIGNDIYIRGEKNNGLGDALDKIRIDRDIQSIYKYNDFLIEASVSKRNADYGYIDLIAHSPNTEESYLISTTKKADFKPNGALTKIDNYFKAQRLLAMQNELKNAQITLPKLKNSLKKFDKQKELQEKTKQHIKLIEDLKVKLNSHPYVGLGLFGAISGGEIDYSQDGKNDEADMLLGALGAIIGGKGLKYLLSRNKDVIKNVLLHHFPDKKEEIDTAFKKEIQKEKRGIYNVAYNNKKATTIKEDLKSIENAILFEEGRQKSHNVGYGAKHINARHSNPKDIGYITQQELLNIGNHMREYLKEHKEPFIDKNGARIYEWKNKQGVRFRVVVGNKGKGASTSEATENQLPSPSRIITFYSDRNFKQKMKFRNPNLKDRGITIW